MKWSYPKVSIAELFYPGLNSDELHQVLKEDLTSRKTFNECEIVRMCQHPRLELKKVFTFCRNKKWKDQEIWFWVEQSKSNCHAKMKYYYHFPSHAWLYSKLVAWNCITCRQSLEQSLFDFQLVVNLLEVSIRYNSSPPTRILLKETPTPFCQEGLIQGM